MGQKFRRIFPVLRYLHMVPALTACLLFSVGIMISTALPFSICRIPAAAAAVLLAAAVLFHRKTVLPFLFLGIIFHSNEEFMFHEKSALCSLITSADPVEILFHSSPRYRTKEGIVQSAFLKTETVTAAVDLVVKTPILPGEVYRGFGLFSPFPDDSAPWKQSAREAAKTQNLAGTFSVISMARSESVSVTTRFAQKLERQMNRYSSPAAGILKAVFRADRADIPQGVNEIFRRCGTAHLIAISGSHTAVIIMVLALIFKLLPIHRNAGAALLSILPWILLVFTGSAPSILRALIMSSIVISACFAKRPISALNTLGAAGLIILALSPHQLFSAGFLLSFASVSGILCAVLLINQRFEPGKVRSAIYFAAVPTAAGTAAAPITAAVFGTAVPVGFAANLFLTPLFSLYFISAVPLFVFGTAVPFFKEALTFITEKYLALTEYVVLLFNQPPLEMINFHIAMIVVPAAVLMIILAEKRYRKQLLMYGLLTAVTMSMIPSSVKQQEYHGSVQFKRYQNADYLAADSKEMRKSIVRWLDINSKSRYLILDSGSDASVLWLIRKSTHYKTIFWISHSGFSHSMPANTVPITADDTLYIGKQRVHPLH